MTQKIAQFIEDRRPATPCMVFDLSIVEDNYNDMRHALPDAQIYYAVKANPDPYVLQRLWAAGIRHFDTASLGEIEIVKNLFPDAICHFMAPVRLPGQARTAFMSPSSRMYATTPNAMIAPPAAGTARAAATSL